jgi:hypothetical protein
MASTAPRSSSGPTSASTPQSARTTALRKWLHPDNHHGTHTALGGRPPASRVTNLSGQYT